MKSLKSRAVNCGPLSEMMRGFASGYFSLTRSRITSMSVSLIDSRKIPMHDRTTVPIQNAAQVIEGRADIDVGDIDMPMLMRLEWLLEGGPLARWLAFPARQESRLFQHPPNARRTHCHNVSIQHHERQAPIAFQRILAKCRLL